MRRPLRLLAPTAAGLLLAVGALAQPAPPGWTSVDLPTSGSHALLYVPPALDRTQPAPLVLFLHGAGSKPEAWKPSLRAPADAAGVVLVAPRSKGLGWEVEADQDVIAEALAVAAARVLVDPRRVSVAGHSAGGAAAVRMAYGLLHGEPSRLAGVFILSSPFAGVEALADPAYTAPLRQYYGVDDPNYQHGSRDAMRVQWLRLAVPFEEQIESGYGHSSWPPGTLEDGFRFLARQIYPAWSASCQPTATSVCLNRGRYRAAVTWRSANAAGVGRPVAVAAGDSGLFWFFSPGNVELLVKVLDGCALSERVWVFASGITDVEFTLTVTDTVSGAERVYANALGHAATPVNDTAAFSTCN